METEPVLQGPIEAKRLTNWVKRYAILSKNFLFYKKKQSDMRERRIINLFGCTIGRGKRYTGQPYIRIEKPLEPSFESLMISFSDKKTFTIWLEALVQVSKNYNDQVFKRNPSEVSIKKVEEVSPVTQGQPSIQQLVPPRLDIQRAEVQFFHEIVPEQAQHSIIKKQVSSLI